MKEKTLADHAEEWMEEKGYKIPVRYTKKWNDLYEKWVNFAFKSLT